jgi:hypothetical protein
MNIVAKMNRGESFIVANDGQFLGKLSLNKFDPESILNPYGLYGSVYSATSIYNQYSTYGSPYSSLSPFNPYTFTPPIIYLRGRKVGFLSVNPYLNGSIDPNNINDWMKYNVLY